MSRLRLPQADRQPVHRVWSVPSVTRVVPGSSLVPVLVVAGQAGHELLRVAVLDVRQEPSRDSAAENRRTATVMIDHHLVADTPVLEAARRLRHDRQHAAAKDAEAAHNTIRCGQPSGDCRDVLRDDKIIDPKHASTAADPVQLGR